MASRTGIMLTPPLLTGISCKPDIVFCFIVLLVLIKSFQNGTFAAMKTISLHGLNKILLQNESLISVTP